MRSWTPYYPGTNHSWSRNYNGNVHGLARPAVTAQEHEYQEHGVYHKIQASWRPFSQNSSVILAPESFRKYENLYRKIPWNTGQVNDLYYASAYFEGFVTQLQKLRANTMCHPFVVTIDGMPLKMQKELESIVEECWLDTAYQAFLYRLLFGIVPYYNVPIEGTAHAFPVIPKVECGQVVTYMDENDVQQFEWEWFTNLKDVGTNSLIAKEVQEKRARRKIHFIRTGYEPMANGRLRSMACPVLGKQGLPILCICF